MIDTLLRDLRQPEYIHVLINPLPIYGLAMAWVGLIVSLFLGSRRAQIATLAIVLISAASAWPVYELGQQSYDRVLSMADPDGQAWLDEHQDRAEDLIYFFLCARPIKRGGNRRPDEMAKIFHATHPRSDSARSDRDWNRRLYCASGR